MSEHRASSHAVLHGDNPHCAENLSTLQVSVLDHLHLQGTRRRDAPVRYQRLLWADGHAAQAVPTITKIASQPNINVESGVPA